MDNSDKILEEKLISTVEVDMALFVYAGPSTVKYKFPDTEKYKKMKLEVTWNILKTDEARTELSHNKRKSKRIV